VGPINPMDFIHLFGDTHEDQLIDFFEFVVSTAKSDHPGVLQFLLELYLSPQRTPASSPSKKQANHPSSRSPEELKQKALALLRNTKVGLDVEAALLTCQLRNFNEGVVVLLEKQGLFKDVLEHYISLKSLDGVMDTCRRHGGQDPQLWISCLHWLAACDTLYTKEVQETLTQIEERELLPPLVVIQILSQNNNATLELVKGYMTRYLQREMSQIQEDKSAIQAFRDETESMRKEIESLRTTAKIVQSRNCSACGQTLDLPSVHFMCSYQGTPCSFHQRCLGENENECPLCGPEHARVKEMAASLRSSKNADVHENFFRQLEANKASDSQRFSTVAEFFSRGLFS